MHLICAKQGLLTRLEKLVNKFEYDMILKPELATSLDKLVNKFDLFEFGHFYWKYYNE
jgi:hypothetical protein